MCSARAGNGFGGRGALAGRRVAPNAAKGRAFGTRSVHGFDLTFAAPKSVSLVRALKGDDVAPEGVRRRPQPPRW